MRAPDDQISPAPPLLFDAFQERRTVRQRRDATVAQLRRLLAPLRYFRRLIK